MYADGASTVVLKDRPSVLAVFVHCAIITYRYGLVEHKSSICAGVKQG